MSPAPRSNLLRPWRSRILRVGLRIVVHTVWLFSVYLLFAGHNQPGGGFAGGLVAGAGFVLVFIAQGAGETRRLMRLAPETFLGLGLVVALAAAALPLAFGGAVLESSSYSLDVPALGTVRTYSVLAFDIGVYLVVFGTITLILRRLGEGEEPA